VVSQNIETFEDNYSFVSKTPNYLVDRSLLNTLVLYENKIGNLLNDYSIGNNEFRILFELAESSHTIKISDLARILLLKTSDITVACTKLEANGFLQKNRSRFDKRASLVDITSKGLSLVWHTATKIDGMFFRVSGDNPNNRAMMLKASRVVARYQRLHFVCS
jgi:DNA-binding MarR family transcriptional regulator